MPERPGGRPDQQAAIVSRQHPRTEGNAPVGFARLDANSQHIGPGTRQGAHGTPATGYRRLGEFGSSGTHQDRFRTLPHADTQHGTAPKPGLDKPKPGIDRGATADDAASGLPASAEQRDNDRTPPGVSGTGYPVTGATDGAVDAAGRDGTIDPPGGGGRLDNEASGDKHRIHVNADGAIVGRERIKTDIKGDDRLIYEAYDLAGNDVLRESFIGDPILEGTHDLLGITFNVAERDDSGRPVKVTGSKTRVAYDDYLKGYAQKLEDEALGPAPEATTDMPPMPEAYHEFVYTYNERGLVTKIVQTEADEGTETKFQRENYYNADGRRTGYVQSRLEDVTANGGEEYTVIKLMLFEYGTETTRDIEYTEFRDGLMADQVLEREASNSPSHRDDEYFMDVRYTTETQPYYLAIHPQTVELHKAGPRTNPAIAPKVIPSWIPKTAVEAVAQGRVSLEEAAEIPSLPEAVGKTIYSVREAFDEVINYITPEALSRFINILTRTEQQAVVAFSPSELFRVAGDHTEPLTDQEKVGIAIALHPLFSREEIVESDYNAKMMDALHLKFILNDLDLPFAVLQERAEQLDDHLTPESRKRVGYLVNLEPGDPNAY
jgi:hypothetical protein